MSTRVRLGLTAVVATLVVLLLPAAASACNEPRFTLNKEVIGPGETVVFTLTDAQVGATYELTVEGHSGVLASGTSSGPAGHSDDFRMPDLGDTRSVSVRMDVTHHGVVDPGHHPDPPPAFVNIRFQAPASASERAPEAAVPQSADRPADGPAAAEPATTFDAGAAPARSTGRQEQRGGARRGAARARTSIRPATAERAPGTPAAAGRAVASGGTARVAGAPAQPVIRPTRAGAASHRARASGTRPTPAAPVTDVPRAAPSTVTHDSDDRHGIPLGALLLLLGIALLAGLVYASTRIRPVRAAPPEPARAEATIAEQDTEELDVFGVETELQRMIAEETAPDPGADADDREPAEALP